ncbi:DUF3696 domain-containing protein [Rouxiella badensis]|uniref:DUF3696 domain-containing protein n=2 Tax=Yersiniaceae TaxID=1903411 RepID=UPI001D15C50A|nr:DUF3696 domain-containing protein [Rouxiella badensis]MCC3735866.1 DUF3696 domain-containing protein [Rouxiella badensis]MCC3761280.1 DUF3696 domain-containing protein [Rouxiella badensis]
MINNISIQNFKSLSILEPIEMESCLFLCGPNSSGKSSFIQAILMISQTFSNNFKDGRVVLNGGLIKLGAFENILSHSANSNNISISFDLFPENQSLKNDEIHKIALEFSFGGIETDNDKRRYNPKLSRVKLEAYSKSSDSIALEPKLSFEMDKFSLTRLDLCAEDEALLDKSYPGFEFTGISTFDGFMPTKIQLQYQVSKKISQDLIPLIINEEKFLLKKRQFKDVEQRELSNIFIPEVFAVKITEIINNKLNNLKRELNIPSEQFNERYAGLEGLLSVGLESFKEDFIAINFKLKPTDIPEHFLKVKTHIKEWQYLISSLDQEKRQQLIVLLDENRAQLQEIWLENSNKLISSTEYEMPILSEINKLIFEQFSRKIKYLGPLRNAPGPFYATNQYDDESVGLIGEFTAALLYKKKDNIISFNCPKVYNKEQNIIFEAKQDTLYNACISWLSYLGILSEIEVGDKGELGYNLQVRNVNDKKLQGLSHVGVGVSQVLPIIVMLLLSEKNDILIFEQPELHLHPKIQSRLCDLFIACSITERQCIIETHSEYIINRLRLRIAQSSDLKIINANSLYFVNKIENYSFFEKVNINRFGAIPNWPEGFFDQTDREIEKIIIAASNKSKKESSAGEETDVNY